MATWTFAAYQARLAHETKLATNPKALQRLGSTLRDVEGHLSSTTNHQDCDGWIGLLRAYETSVTLVVQR